MALNVVLPCALYKIQHLNYLFMSPRIKMTVRNVLTSTGSLTVESILGIFNRNSVGCYYTTSPKLKVTYGMFHKAELEDNNNAMSYPE